MKIAIHSSKGSFSDRWITYCQANKVNYKVVNCYESNIIHHLDGCDGLLWNWNQNDYKAALFARQLTISLEKKGLKVFPNVNTSWHFDDKVGQKYLLEAINTPLVKSYIFYSRSEALNWLETTAFPKVFKLRCGAGSSNVRLVKNKKTAKSLVKKAFGNGFAKVNNGSRLRDRIWLLKRDKNLNAIGGVIKGFARMFIRTKSERSLPKEKGYIYFQDFIPNNQYDTRIVVIGDRCFGGIRFCRKGDFRASGSGISKYETELIDKNFIRIAFDIAKKLNLQSVAFDFVWDNDSPKVVEMSYCFLGESADRCQGYWERDLKWYNDNINPQYLIIKNFMNSITKSDTAITRMSEHL